MCIVEVNKYEFGIEEMLKVGEVVLLGEVWLNYVN